MKKALIFSASIIFLFSSFSFAQEKGQIGINMRVDPSPRIGVTYHIIGKFALRPYIGFSWGTDDSKLEAESPYKDIADGFEVVEFTEQDFSRFTFGVGMFYYLFSFKDSYVYTGIDINYSRETIDSSFSWLDEKYKDTGKTIETSILLGLQVNVVKNLAVFGEVGFGYSHGEFVWDRSDSIVTQNIKTWGLTNSGVGLIFYF
jgi:hypothetical protein